jgi:hypothetical protein
MGLTVGYIAGFIAAALFVGMLIFIFYCQTQSSKLLSRPNWRSVAQVWAPTALAFILSGILRDKNTAATW